MERTWSKSPSRYSLPRRPCKGLGKAEMEQRAYRRILGTKGKNRDEPGRQTHKRKREERRTKTTESWRRQLLLVAILMICGLQLEEREGPLGNFL